MLPTIMSIAQQNKPYHCLTLLESKIDLVYQIQLS